MEVPDAQAGWVSAVRTGERVVLIKFTDHGWKEIHVTCISYGQSDHMNKLFEHR